MRSQHKKLRQTQITPGIFVGKRGLSDQGKAHRRIVGQDQKAVCALQPTQPIRQVIRLPDALIVELKLSTESAEIMKV